MNKKPVEEMTGPELDAEIIRLLPADRLEDVAQKIRELAAKGRNSSDGRAQHETA